MSAVAATAGGWLAPRRRAPTRVRPRVPVRDWIARRRRPRRRACTASTRRWCGSSVALLALGLVMVYSASVALPDNPKFARYAPHPLPGAPRCCRWRIAFVAALLAFQVPMATWEKAAPWLFVVVAAAAGAWCWCPCIGKGVNGARRWIPLGVMNFQPSELAKLGDRALRRQLHGAQDGRARRTSSAPCCRWPWRVAVVGLLLLAEPDMGAFMVIAVIAHGHPVPGRRQRAACSS